MTIAQDKIDELAGKTAPNSVTPAFEADVMQATYDEISGATDEVGVVRIKGIQIAGDEYLSGDMVVAGEVTAIANTTTTDTAELVPLESFNWPVFGDDETPTWETATETGHRILTGVRLTGEENVINKVTALRAYIPYIDPDVRYFFYVNRVGATPNYLEIYPAEAGWFVYTQVDSFIKSGESVDVYLVTQGAGTQFTEFTGEWDYRNIGANPAPTNPPAISNFRQYGTNAPEACYWNVYDRAIVDRTVDLSTMKAGDEVSFQWRDVSEPIDEYTRFTLTETPTFQPHATDQALDMYILTVSPPEPPSDSEQRSWRDFTVKVFADRPLEYVKLTDRFLNEPNAKGLLSLNGLEEVIETNDAYGIDVYRQRLSQSSDWLIIAYNGGSSSSGQSPVTIPNLQSIRNSGVDVLSFSVNWEEKLCPLSEVDSDGEVFFYDSNSMRFQPKTSGLYVINLYANADDQAGTADLIHFMVSYEDLVSTDYVSVTNASRKRYTADGSSLAISTSVELSSAKWYGLRCRNTSAGDVTFTTDLYTVDTGEVQASAFAMQLIKYT